MARKRGFDYFGAMEHLANSAMEASQLLQKIMLNYDLEKLHEQSEEIHEIERDSDEVIKEIMRQLYISFITPLDREDIVQIVDRLDDVLDGINGLTYELYYLNITEIKDSADEFMKLITQAVAAVSEAVKEFSNFKNSKTLMPKIEEANHIESLGDNLYTAELAKLFREEKDPIEIIKWKKVYNSFEQVLDSSEDAADIITGLVIKNS